MASNSGGKNPRPDRNPGDGKADKVSEALRQLWASAEADPVPDDFFDLLDQLDARRGSGTPNQSTEPTGKAGKPDA
jgi:hypothetical protein